MEIMKSIRDYENDYYKNKRFSVAYLKDNTKHVKTHKHEYLEIHFYLPSGALFSIDEDNYLVENNDIFLIKQHEEHSIKFFGAKEPERYVIAIDPEFLNSLSSTSTNLKKLFCDRSDKYKHLSMTSFQKDFILKRIKTLEGITGYGSDLLENSILVEIILFLQHIAVSEEQIHNESENTYIQNIITYVHNNLDQDLTLDTLSAKFFLSKGYVCRLFKEHTGTTLSKYISSKRIEAAKAFLCTGYSVQETAFRSGFNDYANFIRRFTGEVGISPSKYGKENRIHFSLS